MAKLVVCKHCGASIAKGVKVCPHCGGKNKKPFYKRPLLIVFILLLVVGAALGGGSSEEGSSKENEVVDENIEYVETDIDDMMSALSSNALKAQDTYKNQYVQVTGEVVSMDSSGSYFSMRDNADEFTLANVTCNLKNDEQRNQLLNMDIGSIVTVYGKITSVGEVMGYDIKLDKIDGYDKKVEIEVQEVLTCTAFDLIDAMQKNPYKAEKTYKGQVLKITGTLSNIDSDGKYIDIDSEDIMFNFVTIQCYIKDDEVKNAILDLNIGDEITIEGKCKDVGEVMGYSIDITSVK